MTYNFRYMPSYKCGSNTWCMRWRMYHQYRHFLAHKHYMYRHMNNDIDLHIKCYNHLYNFLRSPLYIAHYKLCCIPFDNLNKYYYMRYSCNYYYSYSTLLRNH